MGAQCPAGDAVTTQRATRTASAGAARRLPSQGHVASAARMAYTYTHKPHAQAQAHKHKHKPRGTLAAHTPQATRAARAHACGDRVAHGVPSGRVFGACGVRVRRAIVWHVIQ
eukprot:2367007-Prymnesium_polylepis.5